jgi:tetratricopeptide (TPR) repeat protein
MKKQLFSLIVVSGLLFEVATSGVAASSSKGKKGEKLLNSGNVVEAIEVFKELIEKNTPKNPGLVKEGREGMAKCLLIQAKDAYKGKKLTDAVRFLEDILKQYADTSSVKEAGAYLLIVNTDIGKALFNDGKYEACIATCTAARAKVADGTEGINTVNALIGDCFHAQAKKSIQDKDYKKAIEQFTLVIKEYPQSNRIDDARQDLPDTILSLGLQLMEQKNYSAALECFDRIQKEFPDAKEIALKAKQAAAKLFLAQAKDAIAAKKYSDALEKVQKAVTSLSKDDLLLSQCKETMAVAGEALYRDAEGKINAEQFDAAANALENGLAAGIDDAFSAKCKYALGCVWRLSGQLDKAVACCVEVTKNYKGTPSVPHAYHDLYLIFMKQDNHQDALNNIKLAVMSAPENSDYLFKLAQLQSEMEVSEAQKTFEKLSVLLPAEIAKTLFNKEELQYRLGETYLRLGRYTEAVIEFNKALQRNPALIEAKKGLALAQFSDKDYLSALAAYNELIRSYSVDFDAVRDALAKDASSVAIAAKAESLRSQIALLHYQRGLCYEQLGDFDRALEECRLGLEGVSTQEAAVTLKRIQAQIQKRQETK